MKVTDGQKGSDLRLHQRQSQKEWDEIERAIRPFSTQFSRFLLKPIKKRHTLPPFYWTLFLATLFYEKSPIPLPFC